MTSAIVKQYDSLDRLTKYTDAGGAWTATAFTAHGKPSRVADSLGSEQVFTYDAVAEPRGFVTSVVDKVAGAVSGTISASYTPDGQLATQDLPGQVRLTIGYDAAGIAISRRYTVPDGPDAGTERDVVAESVVVENGAGQWVAASGRVGVDA